ncbi:MAG: amino acid ABC transporter permease [Hyphomicrobiales bacterium]|nr:MAG: amino acid ABC transporter permease [Hyphomicrobiales bacterium]
MSGTLNFSAIWRNFDDLLYGLGLSLGLAFVAILIGCFLGLITAYCLVSKTRRYRSPASIYVTIIRNTPILVLILFTYFAMPQMGIKLGKIESFVATLALYSGAYLAEVFRSGLIAIPPGLREAGLAIGLSEFKIKLLITTPIMFRNILPVLGSTFISLFKDTSLAAAIAIPELTYQARKINVETFRVIETWIVVSFMYVATCTFLAAIMRKLESRLSESR